MLEHRVEARFERTMADVFAALIHELAQGRWSDDDPGAGGIVLPRPGLRFGYRQARRLYSGEVLECLRPVSVVLAERYCGPAVSIIARQRWRVEPLDSATRLRGHIRVETNRFARLQMRFWKAHFGARAQRTCSRVDLLLRSSACAESVPARREPAATVLTGARPARKPAIRASSARTPRR